jgi:predicted GIY-YIG superfamily endonuclease
MDTWYTYLFRTEDGLLETGVDNNLEVPLLGDGGYLTWYKIYSSHAEALIKEVHLKLLSDEERESMCSWYGPSKLLREANALLSCYLKVTPPRLPNMDRDDYYRWLKSLHTPVKNPLMRKFSWAIPTEEAVRTIVKHSPVVEMGAGSGYWAYLVEMLGGEIVAYDEKPPTTELTSLEDWNLWHSDTCFTEVQPGAPPVLDEYPNHTLFLCWPPRESEMASQCLDYWEGDTLILVGNNEVVATKEFHDRLLQDFRITEVIPIPYWVDTPNNMVVWKRY